MSHPCLTHVSHVKGFYLCTHLSYVPIYPCTYLYLCFSSTLNTVIRAQLERFFCTRNAHESKLKFSQRSPQSLGNTRSPTPDAPSQPNMKMSFFRLCPWRSQNKIRSRSVRRSRKRDFVWRTVGLTSSLGVGQARFRSRPERLHLLCVEEPV